MSRETLDRALASAERHVVPFFVLGDPDPALSVEIAETAVAAGATMLELGLPFSDPCADGPDIQAAMGRARRAGVSTAEGLSILGRIHERCPEVPKNLLVYGNLVHGWGAARFCREAAAAGASSLLVPDLPPEEGEEVAAACAASGLHRVLMVAAGTSAARLEFIGARAAGFVYLAALQGVTGGDATPGDARARLVRRVAEAMPAPVCAGFGLRTPRDLREVFAAGARMGVVGSHLARLIGAASSRKDFLQELECTIRGLVRGGRERESHARHHAL